MISFVYTFRVIFLLKGLVQMFHACGLKNYFKFDVLYRFKLDYRNE